MSDPSPILFYDGHCGFCNGMVRIVARLDRGNRIFFAPIESPQGQEVLSRYPILRATDTAFLVERDTNGNERVTWKSAFAARLFDYIRWPEKLLFLPFRIIPRSLGDFLYDLIAKNRNKIFGRHETCPIPPPDIRKRFIGF